jgi:anti-sigma regulatory factor (Ser/Thr protein kinase)
VEGRHEAAEAQCNGHRRRGQPVTRESSTATLLPSTAQTPSVARTFTRETLTRWRLMASYDDVALVVSELVTNAVMHAGGTITVELHRLDHSVRVVVADDSVALPIERPGAADDEAGRGMQLVAAVARDWGAVTWADGGKVVWAEMMNQPAMV